MKQRYEITQIGGEMATKRLEEALEREGNGLSENWQRIVDETLAAQITSDLMEDFFDRSREHMDYWGPSNTYFSFGGVRWRMGHSKRSEFHVGVPVLD